MRQITLPPAPIRSDGEAFKAWVQACFEEIQNASLEDLSQLAKDYTVSNYTETRTLDASSGTLLDDIANFLCTFVYDLQSGGSKRLD
jgi:hypothetical protein